MVRGPLVRFLADVLDTFKHPSLGDIYLGINIFSGEEVAVKLESIKTTCPQLEHESTVYNALAGGVGIPLIRWYGATGNDYHALVMERLGPSLETLFNFCNRKFSLKTVLLLADQLVCNHLLNSFDIYSFMVRSLVSSISTLEALFIVTSNQTTS